ncbi:hypothetical protein BX666DRAFT_1032215 [Dichotomocladium elegans]|nr:hypothetical protein BX666DRAFT_1032215 [Dichotomocladium elegans]
MSELPRYRIARDPAVSASAWVPVPGQDSPFYKRCSFGNDGRYNDDKVEANQPHVHIHAHTHTQRERERETERDTKRKSKKRMDWGRGREERKEGKARASVILFELLSFCTKRKARNPGGFLICRRMDSPRTERLRQDFFLGGERSTGYVGKEHTSLGIYDRRILAIYIPAPNNPYSYSSYCKGTTELMRSLPFTGQHSAFNIRPPRCYSPVLRNPNSVVQWILVPITMVKYWTCTSETTRLLPN